MSVLQKISSPKDIKNLTLDEMQTLAEEVRNLIIDTVKSNGGHLSSNLGSVELTIALYHTFDFPTDKLLFDVGHQSYAHKILSDRKDVFSSLRQADGISGFCSPDESQYDAFVSGHAGNAVAGGLGYCFARDKQGEDYFVISVVGDASLSNGLSLEALNASPDKPDKFVLILNDNGMSISKNNNGFYKGIINSTTKKPYLAIKSGAKKMFGKNFIGKILRKIKGFFKRIFDPNVYIDDIGFKYIGTVNGHNLKEMIKVFKRVKENGFPAFIHLQTVKGKGLKDAELYADVYHGIGKDLKPTVNDFSSYLGQVLCDLAKNSNDVVAVTAGMQQGVGLNDFAKQYPDRFVDVGINEEYAVTLSAGMAKAGLKPFVCIYSTFLQRAYDQIIHDVCLQNLPVVFCIDRAGVVGSDGATHQGVFDLSYLRHVPNLKILCPKDKDELKSAIDYAVSLNCPVAIRYPNGVFSKYDNHKPFNGEWELVKDGKDVTVFAVGSRMIDLSKKLSSFGIDAKIYNARVVKPLDETVLESEKNSYIVTLEDNVVAGGFGSAILEYYAKKSYSVDVSIFGLDDKFIKHAPVDKQLKDNGLDIDFIVKTIKSKKDVTNG